MHQAPRSLVAVLALTSLLVGGAPRLSYAQPAPTPGAAGAPAVGEDEALYSCKRRTGQVAVTFKPETELKDLITWVMGFTCKNFILDPRIVSTGKKVTVIAPNKMSATEAYRVFLVALSTMGLTVVPKGSVLRIVESATAKSETVPILKRGVPNDEDQIVRYVLRPTYTQVETLRQALDSIRSPAGNVAVAGTMLIITDYASQVRDMMSLARSIDVTAHELTHAVTERESGLVYSGESGGMNEAMSDIFGALAEAWVDGGRTGTNLTVSANTWLVGEKILPPALRYMCDPAKDGSSADLWTSSVGSLDVHYSSGVGNLAFCLLSQGGKHPRNKTTTVVPALGMDKAARILYKAQVDILTSNSNYAAVRTAMEQASTALGYDAATKDAVSCAWAAVGVGTAPASCGGGGGGGGGTDGTLTNGTPVTGISDATGGQKFWSITVPAGQTTLTFNITGGTGDADLYVQSGAKPTLTSYLCRPYLSGNAETCTITSPAAGTYWVLLNGYAAYSGVTLTGTYSASGGGGDPYLTNAVPVSNVAGASSSAQYWRINTPAGKTLTVKISGGTGDADLYTRFGSAPTLSTFDCRPFVSGNAETCTATPATAGTEFIMLNGFSAYSGVTLVATVGGGTTATPLTNNVPVTGLSGASGSQKFFKLTVPAGQVSLVFQQSGGTGDADLYVRRGSLPTTSTYDCRPFTSGNAETCTFSNPVAADYFVMVRGFAAYSGVTIVGHYP